MKDNPSPKNIGEISKYIQQLDYRLSIPKFTKESDLTENQKLFKIGNGILNEHKYVTKSKLRKSGSISPESIKRAHSPSSPNSKVYHQMSGGDLQKFIH